jgi:UPF0716 protein FxsA
MTTSRAAPFAARRRRGLLRWVFGALLIVPVVEVTVIVAVGRTIGGWPTFALLLAESFLGAWLVRREGGRTWAALRDALHSGRMPSRQLADAALVLIGGTLLLTPGFVTDAVGFVLILPITRPVARQWLEAVVARRLLRPAGSPAAGPTSRATPGGDGGERPPDVVQGEIID